VTARAVPIPPSRLSEGMLPRVDFADAFAIALPRGAPTDPMVYVERVFRHPPRWVTAAMRARNAAVRPLGLRAPRTTRTGRAYFASVRRVHPYVVRAMMHRAVAF
jgi:Protein of unknown function (DUF2867)